MAIQSWDGEAAKTIFEGRAPRRLSQQVAEAARRKLRRLDGATQPMDMAVPPGNRLHKIEATGRWSVSVDMQYRITFKWGPKGPEEVWFGDYH